MNRNITAIIAPRHSPSVPVDEKISMDASETLEIDFSVENFSSDKISVEHNPNGLSKSYYKTSTFVFNPEGAGTYKLDIEGQVLEIDVLDIPDIGDYQWYVNESSGTTLSSELGELSQTILGPNWRESSSSIRREYIRFDGTDDRLETDTNVKLSDPFTVFGWVRPKNFNFSIIIFAYF
jgi:hypothetical protein